MAPPQPARYQPRMKQLIASIVFVLAACSGSSKPAPAPVGDGGGEPATGGEPVTGGGAPCFKGGCSGQLCSDQEGLNSTCEFRPEYACYRTAECARQADGTCGWTPTAELTACLASPPAE